MNRERSFSWIWIVAFTLSAVSVAHAQTGVDDDRVSLPEGPGSLEGVGDDVEIDPNMGAMSHNVDILLPAGFPGASPSLSLSYSSSAGSGPLGIGWSMKTPTIERMTSRGAPAYDTDDLFDAGGNEITFVGLDNGDRIYRSRFEKSFERYRWVNAGAGDEGYWVIEHTNGSLSYYGADAAGNVVTTARSSRASGGTANYALVETVDPYGHSVRYTYSMETGTVPLLSSISWLDDGSGSHIYTAEIDYETRPDPISDASRGFEENCADRVLSIRVRHETETIREYVLTYQDDTAAGGFSRLERVNHYGVGGEAAGDRHPVSHSFDYSQALGVECTGNDCDSPVIVDMGTLSGAVNLGGGRATLVDINADGLPDVLDTTQTGAHQFFINSLAWDGSAFTHGFDAPTASTEGTGGSFQLGGASTIQVFDVNGDGRSDLLNTQTGSWLENGGSGDWLGVSSLMDVTDILGLDFSQSRFIDLDDDKRVDILSSTTTTTTLYHNEGDSFSTQVIDPLGVAFGLGSQIQFADMNGDGLSDPFELRDDGTVRYRLNYGRGVWAATWRTIPGLDITPGERPQADLEDINGDGIADVVIVSQTQVKYAINRNGDRFDPFVTITSMDIDGNLPERIAGVTVLYADMNANGSDDVVWFTSSGAVTYLELFPRRPNLITTIRNGIGSVQEVSYTTAAQAAAIAEADGNPWTRKLPIPMQLVDSVDRYVDLTGNPDGTGLHEVTEMTYRDGYYDGNEKQYRGFERVETKILGDQHQEESLTQHLFDVGSNGMEHRNGLELETTLLSDNRVLNHTINTYSDCTLDEVPAPADQLAAGLEAIYFPCLVQTDVVHQEGLTAAAEHKTVRTEMTYDGYGNVALNNAHGDIDVTGDELYTETEYVTPTTRWLIGLPAREQVYADPAHTDRQETRTFYDGPDFEGLSTGATHGFVTRVVKTVDNNGALIEATRARRDAHGNSIETIDPNGSPIDADSHRRSYVYDETGFFLTITDLHVSSTVKLRRESRYERLFQKVTEATKWMLVQNDTVQTSRDSDQFRYDEFGRLSAKIRPGDDLDKPSEVYAYDLAAPVSRIIIEARSTTNGTLDEETIRCVDGKGRAYEDRNRIAPDLYQVTGRKAYNARGNVVEEWQTFTEAGPGCSITLLPGQVLSTTTRYDALGRVIEVSSPGETIYGSRLIDRTVYLPLASETWDKEDTAPGGDHANTPTIRTMDGLDRLVRIERTWFDDGSLMTAGDTLYYDNTNTFSGYEDDDGNQHLFTTDLMGRVITVTNPTTGTTTIEYDDASNIVSRTDARGVTVRFAYDGMNRMAERWDDADRDNTLVTWHYDELIADCDLTECTNLPGELVAQRYPIDLGDGRVEPGLDRFGYDARRRKVFAGRQLGSLIDLPSVYGHDNRDRLASITYPDGTVVEQTYDMAGRVTSVPGYLSQIDYDDRSLVDMVTFANGAPMFRTYDDLMRMTSQTCGDGAGDPIHSLDFVLNRMGYMTDIVDSAQDVVDRGVPSLSLQCELDDWYRATSANYAADGESLSYSFDTLDRLLDASSSDTTSVANRGAISFDTTRPHLATAGGSMTYTHDAAGHMTSRGGRDYNRDHLGRLDLITIGGSESGRHAYADVDRVVQMTTDGTLVVYGFDRFEVRDGIGATYVAFDGKRVARHESQMAADLYDDAIADATLNAADAYAANIAGNNTLSMEHNLAASAARLLAEQEDAKAFFATNHLGSILAATDEGGEVRGMRDYYPYGSLRFSDGYVGVYGFTGQERDLTTDLLRMKHRNLDPVTGRWDAWDPAFATLSAENMSKLGEATTGYAYVANGVSWAHDPSGLAKKGFKATMKSWGRNIKGAAKFLFSKPGQGVKAATKGTQYDKSNMTSETSFDKINPMKGGKVEAVGGWEAKMRGNLYRTAKSMQSTAFDMGLDKMKSEMISKAKNKSGLGLSKPQEPSENYQPLSSPKTKQKLLSQHNFSNFGNDLNNFQVGMDFMMDDIVSDMSSMQKE